MKSQSRRDRSTKAEGFELQSVPNDAEILDLENPGNKVRAKITNTFWRGDDTSHVVGDGESEHRVLEAQASEDTAMGKNNILKTVTVAVSDQRIDNKDLEDEQSSTSSMKKFEHI